MKPSNRKPFRTATRESRDEKPKTFGPLALSRGSVLSHGSRQYVRPSNRTVVAGWFRKTSDTGVETGHQIRGHWKLVIVGLLLAWLASGIFYHNSGFVGLAHADYNTTFSHTRTPIRQCQSSIDNSCLTTSVWNYNTTCVTTSSNEFVFNYHSGIAGSNGNNCASADIAISKSAVNLQTASGKMLEMDYDYFLSSGANLATRVGNFNIVLRTNGTLPGFTENYNPRNDISARFISAICPSFNSGSCGASGFWALYATQDPTKTLTQEGTGNDLILSNNAPITNDASDRFEQFVLNYTGGNDWMWITNGAGSSSASSASAQTPNIPQGQTYYVMLEQDWATGQAPCTSCDVLWRTGVNPVAGSLPLTWGLWSVPSSCQDFPLNRAACTTNAATPTFSVNALDPSSWANAIIQGMAWAAGQAESFLLTIITSEINVLTPLVATLITLVGGAIVSIFNSVGGWFGDSSLGTQIAGFMSSFSSFLTNAFGGAIGLLSNMVTYIVNGTNFVGEFFSNNSFTILLFGFVGSLRNVWTVLNGVWGDLFKWFASGAITSTAMVEGDWILGTLWTAYSGISGFKAWLDINETLIVKLVRLGIFFVNHAIDILTKIVLVIKGRVMPFTVAGNA